MAKSGRIRSQIVYISNMLLKTKANRDFGAMESEREKKGLGKLFEGKEILKLKVWVNVSGPWALSQKSS